MSAFKQFNAQDVVVSPFEVNKGFNFYGLSGADYIGTKLTASNVGIDRFFGRKGDYLISSSFTTGNITTQSQALIYDSVKQLY